MLQLPEVLGLHGGQLLGGDLLEPGGVSETSVEVAGHVPTANKAAVAHRLTGPARLQLQPLWISALCVPAWRAAPAAPGAPAEPPSPAGPRRYESLCRGQDHHTGIHSRSVTVI